MQYTINENIIFDTVQSTLFNTQTEQSVTLSISQSHILELLINSNADIIPKDKLINDLWDKHGISTSGHTLNQYVSILRNVLNNLGCADYIITIPRIGLRVNPDIMISRQSTVSSQSDVKEKKGSLSTKCYVFIVCIVTLLIVLPVFYLINSKENELDSPKIKNCLIKSIQDFSAADQLTMKRQAEEILLENNLTCNSQRVVFFGRYKLLSDNNYGRTLLSYCSLNGRGDIISCDNYYYQNWRLN